MPEIDAMGSAPVAPSGEQVEIELGDQRAVIVEVGGGLRTYSARGRELLDGYGASEMCTSRRGQVLVPWPNRAQDGTYEFGRSHQLPLNEPERRNAIHGLVRWAPWTVGEREPHRAIMRHRLHPEPGDPFTLALSVEYAPTSAAPRSAPTGRGCLACTVYVTSAKAEE